MGKSHLVYSFSYVLTLSILLTSTYSDSVEDNFLKCLSSTTLSPNILLSQNSSAYSAVLRSSARNRRFLTHTTPKPSFIITPKSEIDVQKTILCAKDNEMEIRTRCGGHDYEGLSYVSYKKFVLIDLVNMRSIDIDIQNETAWVQGGSTVGALYYNIAKKSNVHAFNGGTCPTVGVGGHISGGGLGTLSRKYGVAADSVIDAKMVDANGRILDRNSMGEDVFWAIRGGGAASFGVILSWKVRLVSVPRNVTVLQVSHTLEEGGGKLLSKWQSIAHKFPKELYTRSVVDTVTSNSNTSTIRVSFYGLFLGDHTSLLSLMQSDFPELNLKPENCKEMSWIRSVLFFADLSPNTSLDVLIDRKQDSNSFYKAKSDYVKEPISESGLQGLFERLVQVDTQYLVLTAYGGRMSEIHESDKPYPNRNGTLFQIQYMVNWYTEEKSEYYIEWMKNVYWYMEPHVSKSPREACLNYRDLDLGTNNPNGNTSFEEASSWGLRYFKNNFKRLAHVKTAIDPSNFFKHEQSIPLMF